MSPGPKPPPSGLRRLAGLRLAPAELAEVQAALLPGERLAAGLRRLVLEAARKAPDETEGPQADG